MTEPLLYVPFSLTCEEVLNGIYRFFHRFPSSPQDQIFFPVSENYLSPDFLTCRISLISYSASGLEKDTGRVARLLEVKNERFETWKKLGIHKDIGM